MRKYLLRKEPLHARPFQIQGNASVTLPPSIDLRPKCTPVRDQGSLGSCTAFAICGAMELDEQNKSNILSPLFQYYNERVADGDVSQDNGSTMTQAVTVMVRYGICQEQLWQYNVSQFAVKPSANCFTNALGNKGLNVVQVSATIQAIKTCLAQSQPVILGIMVYASFESASVAQTGIIPLPAANEQLLGGHAIVCVGYSDANSWLICKNSWGADWGDKGYFYLPYSYITMDHLASDIWCIPAVTNPPPTPTPTPPTPPVPVPPSPSLNLNFNPVLFTKTFASKYITPSATLDANLFASALVGSF